MESRHAITSCDNLAGRDSALTAKDAGHLTYKPWISSGKQPGGFSIDVSLNSISAEANWFGLSMESVGRATPYGVRHIAGLAS